MLRVTKEIYDSVFERVRSCERALCGLIATVETHRRRHLLLLRRRHRHRQPKPYLLQYHLSKFDMSAKVNFILSVPAFSHWRSEDATRLAYSLTEKEYQRGTKVIECAESVKSLTFIRQGAVMLSHPRHKINVSTKSEKEVIGIEALARRVISSGQGMAVAPKGKDGKESLFDTPWDIIALTTVIAYECSVEEVFKFCIGGHGCVPCAIVDPGSVHPPFALRLPRSSSTPPPPPARSRLQLQQHHEENGGRVSAGTGRLSTSPLQANAEAPEAAERYRCRLDLTCKAVLGTALLERGHHGRRLRARLYHDVHLWLVCFLERGTGDDVGYGSVQKALGHEQGAA